MTMPAKIKINEPYLIRSLFADRLMLWFLTINWMDPAEKNCRIDHADIWVKKL